MMRRIAHRVVDQSLSTKNRTYSITFGSIQSGGSSVSQLTYIARGAALNERESDAIRVKSIFFEGLLSSDNEPCNVRMALVWNSNDVGTGYVVAPPQISYLWDTVGGLGDATWTPRNLEQTHNWIIIWERRYHFGLTDFKKPVKIYKKLDHVAKYHGYQAQDGSKGQIWLIVTSDSAAPPHQTLDGIMRVMYKDD